MSTVAAPVSTRLGWVSWAGTVLGTLLAMAWIGTAIDDRNAARKELQSARYEFEEKQARATNLEALKFQLNELELMTQVITRRLPSRFDAALDHAELRGLAKESGVELVQMTDHDELKKEFYAARDVEVELRGSPESIYRYLEALTRWGPAKNLSALEFSATSPTSTSLHATVRVTFYRYIDEGEAMGGAAYGSP